MSIPEWFLERRSLQDRPVGTQDFDLVGGSIGSMFIEDIHTYAAFSTYSGSSRGKVDLESSSDSARDELAAVLGRYGASSARGIDGEICEFLQETCKVLAYEGELVFELVRNPDADETPKFILNPIYGPKVRVFAGRAIQVFRDSQGPRNYFRSLRVPDFWHLKLPRSLGSPAAHRKLIQRLAQLSVVAPDFYVQDINGASAAGFDLNEFRQRSEAEVLRQTARWGWTARSMWGDGPLEYFRIWRLIRFHKMTGVLMLHTIDGFNRLLEREGLNCKVSLPGMPSPDEYSRALADLEGGEVSFADAYERVASLRR